MIIAHVWTQRECGANISLDEWPCRIPDKNPGSLLHEIVRIPTDGECALFVTKVLRKCAYLSASSKYGITPFTFSLLDSSDNGVSAVNLAHLYAF